jgi:diguanylate cyclase (GGDEF)-like protein
MSPGDVREQTVLLVEDDPLHVLLTSAAVSESSAQPNLEVVQDAPMALAFLRNEAPFEAAPRPDLVLLDVNLPGTSGHEFLVQIQSEEAFENIPVIMLSSSVEASDVEHALASGATGYLSKSPTFQGFLVVARAVDAALATDDSGATTAKPQGPRVLIVEDDPLAARLVVEVLHQVWDDAVDIVHVESLDEIDPDVVVSWANCALVDLCLPDAEGLEAVARLRVLNPGLAQIVLTSRVDEELAVEALAAGAQDYLVKGRIDPQLLGRAIRYAIERKSLEAQLAHAAFHDPLTGIANRSRFREVLAAAWARSAREEGALAVFFLDLDGFKVINDDYGHEAGDDLLVAVSAALLETIRVVDTVARFGGDEFVVLCENVTGAQEAREIAHRLQQAVAASTAASGAQVTASIGFALADEATGSPHELLRCADAAMYAARAGTR